MTKNLFKAYLDSDNKIILNSALSKSGMIGRDYKVTATKDEGIYEIFVNENSIPNYREILRVHGEFL